MRTATGFSIPQLRELRYLLEHARDFNSGQRRKAAQEGAALPDGSYPIYNQDNAVQAIGRAPEGKRDAVKAHVRKRAKALGLKLPGSMASGD